MPAHRTFDRDKVAALMVEAIELGLPVMNTIIAVTGCTPNQARHMVRTIRQDGHLGYPPHVPARAVIHRGSLHEKSWVACAECTTPWPCTQAYPYGTHIFRPPEKKKKSRRKKGSASSTRQTPPTSRTSSTSSAN